MRAEKKGKKGPPEKRQLTYLRRFQLAVFMEHTGDAVRACEVFDVSWHTAQGWHRHFFPMRAHEEGAGLHAEIDRLKKENEELRDMQIALALGVFEKVGAERLEEAARRAELRS